jgi:hypothetical protein
MLILAIFLWKGGVAPITNIAFMCEIAELFPGIVNSKLLNVGRVNLGAYVSYILIVYPLILGYC